MQEFIKKIKEAFQIKPHIEKEALDAYLNRLPRNIQISWFRDGNYIVGDVDAGEHEFKTQGDSVDNFIDMVNDSIYTVYDIPQEYLHIVSSYKTYKPSPDGLADLNNTGIKRSKINLVKEKEEVLQHA